MITSGKVFAIVAAVALTVGSTAAMAAPAGARMLPPRHDATSDTLQCNDVIGRIYFFGSSLTSDGTTPIQPELVAKSDDCISPSAGSYDPNSNPNGVSISLVTIRGNLNPITNCVDLFGLSTATSGFSTAADTSVTLTVRTLVNTPRFLTGTSTLSIPQTWTGTYNDGGSTSPAAAADSWGSSYLYIGFGKSNSGLQIGSTPSFTAAPGITGNFQGGDGGQTSYFQVTSQQSLGAFSAACFGTRGVRSIPFGIGGFTLQ